MKVSVALCTYNGERFLREQLDSIARQTRLPDELKICDDGSSDRTHELIRTFMHTAPFSVELTINQLRLGSTRNFEQAIRQCTWEAIALSDQDDVWAVDKLERMLIRLEEDPAIGGIFSDATLIDDHGRPCKESLWQRANFTPPVQKRLRQESVPRLMIERAVVTGATLVFRASLLQSILPIPPGWIHDRWIATLIAALSRLEPISAELIQYRIHATQQIGMTKLPWQVFLRTERTNAIAFHSDLADQIETLAGHLQGLPVDQAGTGYALDQVRFLRARAESLKRGRAFRVWTMTPLLIQYFRFAKGGASYLRDLAYESKAP